jgi:hypothetical protein
VCAGEQEAEQVTQELTGSVFERLVRANIAGSRSAGGGGVQVLLCVDQVELLPASHAHEAAEADGRDAPPVVDAPEDGRPWTAAQEQVPPAPAPGHAWQAQREAAGSQHGWSPPGLAPEPEHSLPTALVAAQAAVAGLLTGPTSGRPHEVAAVLALAEQLRGLGLRGLAEMEATGGHAEAGAATAATWLRDTQLLSDTTARAHVRLATTLRAELPQVEDLLCAGGTTLEHARAAVAGSRGLDPELLRDSQEAICALLTSTDPQATREQLRERAEALNPELGRAAERRAHARRGLTADAVPSGLLLGGSLGVEEGQVLLLGLDLAVQADRADGDARSLRQRRADALVQWARQAATAHGGDASSVADDLRTTRTHLLLTCTSEQLAAAQQWLDDLGTSPEGPARPGSAHDVTGDDWPWKRATTGSPGRSAGSRTAAGGSFGPDALTSSVTLRRLVCDAALSLAVLPAGRSTSGATGADVSPPWLRTEPRLDPLYVGRAARIVTASQWKALALRDRRCVVKGCRRPPSHCQAHHVRHWLDGGRTDLDNLVLLCQAHHHDHHDRGQDLQHRDGSWLTATGWAHAPP